MDHDSDEDLGRPGMLVYDSDGESYLPDLCDDSEEENLGPSGLMQDMQVRLRARCPPHALQANSSSGWLFFLKRTLTAAVSSCPGSRGTIELGNSV